MLRLLYVLAQVLGVAAALCGLYLLTGPAWALLVGGAALLAVATLAEFVEHRPAAARSE